MLIECCRDGGGRAGGSAAVAAEAGLREGLVFGPGFAFLHQGAEAIGAERGAQFAQQLLARAGFGRVQRLPHAAIGAVGRLPSGETMAQAIEATDAATDGHAVYYMINCAHPAHFEHALRAGGAWRERVRGLRANASRRSHAELDEATELDAGDPPQLGAEYRALRPWLPRLAVVGGCCGTDHRHVAAICAALAPAGRAVEETTDLLAA